ncbi:FAD-dependent oxidoreductase [Salinirubellus salinus]|jgi:sulfide:quinone oxidoreductase|uniref:FAD-dependent oxidoreductase n=1 Tax=Salinirubellus salinus TaxID=1364945 RepID=A0A9E7R1X1_9EURY|nr:FAD-dependent oxidoreductase [Salinirubellus salinus]UWM53983.1 FAD-dependent oxidoreductase [Salinirubellus salinus]
MTSSRPTVLVLGAGAGGTMTANKLRRRLDADVTVVDRSPTHSYQPAYYLVPFDYMDLDDQVRETRDLLHDDVAFVQDEVTGVDPERRVVTGEADEYEYDVLVSAVGNSRRPDRVPGMLEGWNRTDSVYPFYHESAAAALGDAVDAFDGGTFLVTVPDTPIKCGGAPLKLTMLMEEYLRERGVREDAEVVMTKPGPDVFGTGPKAPYQERIEEIWADRDITFVPEFTVSEVDYERQVVHSEAGESIEYDLYAPVPPQYGHEFVVENSPLTDGGEYVSVDDHTLQHETYPEVFALGDNADVPTSRTASAARKQSHVVVENVERFLADRPLSPDYGGYTACPILVEKGKAMIAEFDYEESISAPVVSRLNWILDVNVIPSLYWNVWMRGYDPVP